MYSFSKKSKERLEGVDSSLIKLMEESIKESPYDFGITEGIRTPERQKQLYDEGKSLTLKSKHLIGRAVDIAVFVEGKLTWDFKYYKPVAEHIKKVAETLKVNIIWGGDWRRLVDAPHFELKD
jgi:peptidoglycan L-alanyl-D-glutamate endopeptidase CwlK